MDSPVDRTAGVSSSREQKWGLIGGLLGAAVGIGSAVIAVGIDGSALYETGLYPSLFRKQQILALDLYLLAVLVVGAGFSAAALVFARRSPYPRTECYGAGLMGLILSLLAGFLLFLRVTALLAG